MVDGPSANGENELGVSSGGERGTSVGAQVALACMKRRRVVFALVALIVVAAAMLIPRLSIDTDPENMLPADQPDRVRHDLIKDRFNLSDMIVVGVVDEADPKGVFDPKSLSVISALTDGIRGIDGVIARDVMSIASVDNITQSGPGAIRFEWMMNTPAQSQAQADRIREAVNNLPTLRETVSSTDGKAAAIYVPIRNKDASHRIAGEIQDLVDGLDAQDEVHITGLPVAEDTFGVEMFIQMGISAPLAALVIFLVMWFFFRSLSLVLSPLILAMATVVVTMGALIGLGFPVHIMSSMIPIFLMPIAVVDSVHILSEFADRYRPGADARETLARVLSHLFRPMLFTSLTSAIGFASLMFTPIPPVRVFGAFVAFGIVVAFVFSVTLVPAWVASMRTSRLEAMAETLRERRTRMQGEGLLARTLTVTGRFTLTHGKWVIAGAVGLLLVAGYGITQIQINDNPTRWFQEDHRIRVADRVLNEHFAGTYMAYLTLSRPAGPKSEQRYEAAVREVLDEARRSGVDLTRRWRSMREEAQAERFSATLENLSLALGERLFDAPSPARPYWEQLLAATDRFHGRTKYFQSPDALRYVAGLEEHLSQSGLIGKSSSAVDIVRTVYRELLGGGEESFRIPDTRQGVAQTLLSFQSSHRPYDLWHFVTPAYDSTTLWLQLRSGDNQHMQRVIESVEEYVAENPLPAGVSLDWSGLTYINFIWQQEMVAGMLTSLLAAFAVVLVIMIGLFRSVLLGVLAMVPLSVTMVLIYGAIGLVGKPYDMPVAVLSALTLGLSIDFAIHFIARSRELLRQHGDWYVAMDAMFQEPARAIARNALVIAIGFLPLLAAPLVPYNTVGILMAAIMSISAVITLLLLPALMTPLRRLLKTHAPSEPDSHSSKEVG